MPGLTTSLTTLPTEIIVAIFVYSSNPALALACRELNSILAPLSRSISARVDFLFWRYRKNYVKAVLKGLRWSFFDLELLQALDRFYRRERLQTIGSISQQKLQYDSIFQPSLKKHLNSGVFASEDTSTASQDADRPRKRRKKYQLPKPDHVSQEHTEAQMTEDYNRKGLGRLQDPCPASAEAAQASAEHNANHTYNQEIPLPKDFELPRRLFKSDGFMPLLRVLFARGASPTYSSSYPLVRSCQRGDIELVKLLFEAGAHPDQKALRWVCVGEHYDILDMFLERGVLPDQQCLSLCVEKGKTGMVDRLLGLGVVPDMKTLMDL